MAGVRFLTAADLKRIYPDSISKEGTGESYIVSPLELGKTVFLLDGANHDPENLFRGWKIDLPAPFTAKFKAEPGRQLFAAFGNLLVRDKKRGAFFITPGEKSSLRVGSAFRSISSISVASYAAVSVVRSGTFGDFGLLVLPKLARMAQTHYEGAVSLPPQSFVNQYLDCLHLARFPETVSPAQLVPVLKTAEVVFGPTGDDGFTPLRSDVDHLLERVLPLLAPSPFKKIYFRRKSRRNITNEEEIIPYLTELGFEIIDDDHRDVLKTAALFRGADFIVAPHGALLANILYCQPGTVLVELLPGPFAVVCYRNTSAVMGIRYHAIFCTKLTPFNKDVDMEDFSVDTKKFRAALEIILGATG